MIFTALTLCNADQFYLFSIHFYTLPFSFSFSARIKYKATIIGLQFLYPVSISWLTILGMKYTALTYWGLRGLVNWAAAQQNIVVSSCLMKLNGRQLPHEIKQCILSCKVRAILELIVGSCPYVVEQIYTIYFYLFLEGIHSPYCPAKCEQY